METKKALMSAITAIATSRLAKSVSSIELDDVLGVVGLERQRNRALDSIGLVALGAFVGAGTALLLAPAPGHETRARLGRELNKLGSAAADMANEMVNEVPMMTRGNESQRDPARA